jgi:hypothetical protein
MCVPKATMNLNREFSAYETNIWRSRQFAAMKTISPEAEFANHFANKLLRGRFITANSPHIFGATLVIDCVH